MQDTTINTRTICSLHVSLRPQDCVIIPNLEQCATYVSRWFTENALLLNPTKTEAVIFGTSRRLGQVSSTPGVMVAGAHVKFSNAVKLLGVTLGSALTFDKHITNITRCCFNHIHALSHIRPLLTLDTANTIAASIVGSRLDYCLILYFFISLFVVCCCFVHSVILCCILLLHIPLS